MIALTSCPAPGACPIRSLMGWTAARRDNFARDLQERLGILALFALLSSFRMCNLLILLVAQETDPVSGHHILTCTLAPCDSTFKLNAVLAAVVYGNCVVVPPAILNVLLLAEIRPLPAP